MQASNRIILNTLVQYVRSVLYMLLALVSTRLVMEALGHSAYGVYSVVGGVVSMLGFLTHSLATSTQRFLSYSHGLANKDELRIIFANAFSLHIGVALVVVLVIGALEPLCMGGLNIPVGMEDAAVFVYFMVLMMVLLAFVTAPVRALFIARENIVYVAVVEILDAVLKVVGAIALPYIPIEGLRVYALMLVGVALFNFACYFLYARMHYAECRQARHNDVSRQRLKSLCHFAVWNVYDMGATVIRIQGLAIIINRFLGTVANAAYGVAQQMSNAASFIVLSILNAINPQLMAAEGAGHRERMLQLCIMQSRYAFLTLALVLLPVVVEMEGVLSFWLGNAPEHAALFCRFILVIYVMDQLTIGLASANQATGQVKAYALCISSIRPVTLVAVWLCLWLGYEPKLAMWCYFFVELTIGVARIPFMKITAQLPVAKYLREVVVRNALPVGGALCVAWLFAHYVEMPLRFVATATASVGVGVALVVFTLRREERMWLTERVQLLRSKLKGR